MLRLKLRPVCRSVGIGLCFHNLMLAPGGLALPGMLLLCGGDRRVGLPPCGGRFLFVFRRDVVLELLALRLGLAKAADLLSQHVTIVGVMAHSGRSSYKGTRVWNRDALAQN